MTPKIRTDQDLKLVTAASHLAAVSPNEYINFIGMLASYAEHPQLKVLYADAGTILNAQGRAAALHELMTLLHNPRALLQEHSQQLAQQKKAPSAPKGI